MQQQRKHVVALSCRATAGHEIEPCRHAVFIRPPLTPRSPGRRVSSGIPRHARPPLPCTVPHRCQWAAASWGPPPSLAGPMLRALPEQRRHSGCTVPSKIPLRVGLAPLLSLSLSL
jgi:hypothetical protein